MKKQDTKNDNVVLAHIGTCDFCENKAENILSITKTSFFRVEVYLKLLCENCKTKWNKNELEI